MGEVIDIHTRQRITPPCAKFVVQLYPNAYSIMPLGDIHDLVTKKVKATDYSDVNQLVRVLGMIILQLMEEDE